MRLQACVATPHHLASRAGADVLGEGGNAMDAVIAAALVLAVVTPYRCGLGGDLMAIVGRGGDVWGYLGCGRAARGTSIEAVRAANGGSTAMPRFGPHTVTVPGAVRGWFDLLERFGTMGFAEVGRRAMALARDGFTVSAEAAGVMARSRARFRDAGWRETYGAAEAGAVLRQRSVARTLEVLSEDGPASYYRGRVAEAVVAAVQAEGGHLASEDLASHQGTWVAPLSARYRDVEVLELPPPTQGVALLEALRIVESYGPLLPVGADRNHLLIEATKLALADLGAFVSDPDWMTVDPADLISDPWITDRRRLIMERSSSPEAGPRSTGGTAYLASADASGLMVSLIQSNYVDFGSGIFVGDWGINLHNRGSDFMLDPDGPAGINALAPSKRTRHTLIPGLIRRDNRPWAAFGTRGGDLQPSVGLQVVTFLVDDALSPEDAVAVPRWVVAPPSWIVGTESSFDRAAADSLRSRGHPVIGVSAEAVGHVNVICADGGRYAAGSDPRTEGAVEGTDL